DTSAARGALSNAGLQASQAGPALQAFLSALVRDNEQGAEVLRRYKSSHEELRDTPSRPGGSVPAGRTRAAANLWAGDGTAIAGERGARAMLALISQVDGLEGLTESMNNAEGAAAEMAKTMTDSVSGSLKELDSAIEEIKLQLGDAGLKEAFRSAVDFAAAFA